MTTAMRSTTVTLIFLAHLVVIFSVASPSRIYAQHPPVALSGQVTSQEEGAMEGVVVSAKKDGSTITVSVASDKEGHFEFPGHRLEPGHYSLAIRAVGYDLDGPATADVAAGHATALNLALRKTTNLASQLPNAEWLMSMPGTDKQKSSPT